MSSDGESLSPAVSTSHELVISARSVGKSYHIYVKPQDRLKQALWRGRRRYYREFWALRDVSFDVHRGEAVGIIGRNGCGKSTLLQIIAGTLTPTEGEVRISGRIAALLELGSGFNPDFTGRENVFMNGAILGISRKEMEQRFDDIAAFADIGEFLDQPVKTYSSGMFARLAFAVAINVDPDILIVDEILAVGDMLFQHRCVARIRRLCEAGTTLVFVSHDPDTIRGLCNKCVWLENGQTRMIGEAKLATQQYTEALFKTNNAQTVEETLQSGAVGGDEAGALRAAMETVSESEMVVVESTRILNENNLVVETIKPGETFHIAIVLRSRLEVSHISVGIVIKDHLGIELTGESVFNKLRSGMTLRQGHPVRVRFSAVNNLRSGNYSVAVRINRVSRWDRGDNVLLYNDETAAAFHVMADPDQPMWFRFRHPFEVTVT